MDIWHTCEPEIVGTEGWVGGPLERSIHREKTLSLPYTSGTASPEHWSRRMCPWLRMSDLSNYGLFTGIEQQDERDRMVKRFAEMYGPAIGVGPVKDIIAYMGQTGQDALKGADMLKSAPETYTSTVEYADSKIAQALQAVSMVHTAEVGSRFFYTSYSRFDTHGSQNFMHPKLLTDLSRAVADFWDDLREHDADGNVVMLLFSEFGRRVKENGGGTDHGPGGVAFAIGPSVKGGMYSEYPSIRTEDLVDGDLEPNLDFRGLYSTLLEDWVGLDPVPIVNGRFEQPKFIEKN